MWTGYREHSKEEIQELITKYPWLENRATAEHNVTWLDDLEPGWYEAFGKELCEELAEAIEEDGSNEFEIIQIKEKFGALRFYAAGYGLKTRDVIAKYEELSKYVCGHCGKPAKYITTGWIYPLCEYCIEEINGHYAEIWDFYNFANMEEVDSEVEKIKTNYIYSDYWKPVK